MLELVINSARGGEQRHTLQQREYVLGRDPDVHIPLQDRKVSRRHARIFRQGHQYWIEDLGSANGVLIAGETIRAPLALQGGMELSIGPFQLTIVDDSQLSESTYALVGLGPPFLDQRFVLPAGTIEVGRVEGNAIVIPDASVSRKQASLIVAASSVIIEDHGSSNGTWVNEVQVTRRVLTHGDHVRFGNVPFQFVQHGRRTVDFGGVRRLVDRVAHGDRSIQGAAIIALLSAALLLVTIGVFAHRRLGPSASPGTLEEAYETALQVGIAMGEHHMKRGEWDDAIRAYRDVLNQDPINPTARRGMVEARRSQKHQRLLRAAEQDLAGKAPQSALYKAADVPPDSYYATQAQQLRERAVAATARDAFARAERACRARAWRECHVDAVLHLQHQPDSVAGRNLLQQAEREMRADGTGFTPWAGSGSDDSPALDLAARWQHERVRTAAEKYAAGSLTLALDTLESVKTMPQARALTALLSRFGDAKTQGDGAAVAGNIDAATTAWEQALRIDAQIVPSSFPSVFREQIKQRLGDVLYERGREAFNRGQYAQAFTAWQRALERDPEHRRALEGLEGLEARAASLLSSLGAADNCRQLAEVMGMTRAASRIHQDAAQRARDCPR